MNSDGTVRYTPPTGFVGQVTFSYTVEDSLDNVSNPALVTLNVVNSLFQNDRNRFDVNDDGEVSPVDVLIVINSIRRGGVRTLGEGEPNPPYVDVDGSRSVEPIDVLQVINEIRRRSRSGEGEPVRVDQALSDPAYVDSFNIRKRSKLTDLAFSDYEE
jgi:hypothetical protein